MPCHPPFPTPLSPRRYGFGGASPVTPFPSPPRNPGILLAPDVTPLSSFLHLSSKGCRPYLPAPQLPGIFCTPSPWSCVRLSISPPVQLAPSACQTPTKATPGLWTPPPHHRHRRIPPSPSAIDVPSPPDVGLCLSLISFSPLSVPRLCRHCFYPPPPVPPPGITNGEPLRPPRHWRWW